MLTPTTPTGRCQIADAATHAEADDPDPPHLEPGTGQVREGRLDVGFHVIGAQRHDLAHDLLHVLVVDRRVTGAVEEVGRDREVALGCESAADVLDVVVDAEGLLEHHDRGRCFARGLGFVETHRASGGLELDGLGHGDSFRVVGRSAWSEGGSPAWGTARGTHHRSRGQHHALTCVGVDVVEELVQGLLRVAEGAFHVRVG